MLVEFALTVPLLFLLFFVMIEFGRYNLIRHGVDTAAYEGARRGIVPGATVDDVKANANAILQAVSALDTTVTVTPSAITDETPEVTVTVDVLLNRNGWIVPRFLNHATLSRSCTIAREELGMF
jgi:Flp pilus assembly protein TadG